MAALPKDQAARDAAARAFDRNVVVVAGAGSGKTTLLIERLLNLVLARDVRLSRVAALTFTEKAAAEMRTRLASQLSALAAALREGGGPVEAQRLLESRLPATLSAVRALEWAVSSASVSGPEAVRRVLGALEDLDAGAIGTIHSFCADLLRRHPREARLDPGFVVDEGLAGERLFDEEWTEYQARELGADSPRPDAWRKALASTDVGTVRGVSRALVELPPSIDLSGIAAQARVRDECEALLAEAGEAACLATNRNFSKWLPEVEAVLGEYLARGMGAAKASLEVLGLKSSYKPTAGAKCTDSARVEAFVERATRILRAFETVDDAKVADVVALARDVAGPVRERWAREGVVGFSGLLSAARDLLREHPDVRREEQERFQAILLDEFQDTDPLQYEIALLLAEKRDGAAASDAWLAELEPGRLFLVGDPKQSIYRFRDADMAACERVIERVKQQGGRELTLSASFRSRLEIVAAVNHLFERTFVESPPYQPRYEPIEAARPDAAAGKPCVELWTVRHDGDGAPQSRSAEARAVARWILAECGEGRPHALGDVALLLRALTDVQLFQRALSAAGIPFVTQGGREFARREEIVQALALLRCLARPNDATALLSVLRSASCGASDAELAAWGRLGVGWSFRSHSRVPADRQREVRQVLRTLRGLDALAREAAQLPADDALRLVLEGGGAPDAWRPRLLEMNAAAHGGPQRLANLAKLVSRAAELSRSDGLSLSEAADELAREFRGEAESESPLADEAVQAVRVMSVHAAKGLEFPVVILPDLGRGENARNRGGLSVSLAEGSLAVRLPDGTRNSAAFVAERENARHEEAERLRLLYVAVTRAKERLVLVNAKRDFKKAGAFLLALRDAWGYDPSSDGEWLAGGLVRHVVVVDAPLEEQPAASPPLDELVDAVLAQDAARQQVSTAARGRPLAPTSTGREALERLRLAQGDEPTAGESATATWQPSEEEPAEATIDRTLAATVGIAVHAALELGSLDDGAALAVLGRRAATLAVREIGAGSSTEQVAAEASRLLERLPGSELAKRLSGARVIAREHPVLLSHDGERWQGIIDLVVEIDGAAWVVDWKTDRAVEPEKHRAQLALYGEAVRRWLSLPAPPGLALAYVHSARWVTLREPAA